MQLKTDTIIYGPSLTMEWDPLKNLGFPIIDAALYVQSTNTIHFFSQDKCGHVDWNTNEAYGPYLIRDAWDTTLGNSNFTKVDAILPYTPNLAYFFSDDLYILVDTLDMILVSMPSVIIQSWLALKRVGFSSVDVPSPNNHIAYFFKGIEFVVIKSPPERNNKEVINGQFMRAKDHSFQSLKILGFYGDFLVDQ